VLKCNLPECLSRVMGIKKKTAIQKSYHFIHGNLFVSSEWKNGMLECWSIGDKDGTKTL
jgi:hypothetical protein